MEKLLVGETHYRMKLSLPSKNFLNLSSLHPYSLDYFLDHRHLLPELFKYH